MVTQNLADLRNRGSRPCTRKYGARKLVASMWSNCPAVQLSIGVGAKPDALFTSNIGGGRPSSAAMIVAALWLQSLLLFFFALMGAQSLLTSQNVLQAQRRMSARRGFLALAAYLFTILAHMMGGASMFLRYL